MRSLQELINSVEREHKPCDCSADRVGVDAHLPGCRSNEMEYTLWVEPLEFQEITDTVHSVDGTWEQWTREFRSLLDDRFGPAIGEVPNVRLKVGFPVDGVWRG